MIVIEMMDGSKMKLQLDEKSAPITVANIFTQSSDIYSLSLSVLHMPLIPEEVSSNSDIFIIFSLGIEAGRIPQPEKDNTEMATKVTVSIFFITFFIINININLSFIIIQTNVL